MTDQNQVKFSVRIYFVFYFDFLFCFLDKNKVDFYSQWNHELHLLFDKEFLKNEIPNCRLQLLFENMFVFACLILNASRLCPNYNHACKPPCDWPSPHY